MGKCQYFSQLIKNIILRYYDMGIPCDISGVRGPLWEFPFHILFILGIPISHIFTLGIPILHIFTLGIPILYIFCLGNSHFIYFLSWEFPSYTFLPWEFPFDIFSILGIPILYIFCLGNSHFIYFLSWEFPFHIFLSLGILISHIFYHEISESLSLTCPNCYVALKYNFLSLYISVKL